MGKTNFSKIKLLKIWEILKQESDEDRPLTTSMIIDRLADHGISCDRRTLYADINELIKNGYDIKYRHGQHSNLYYIEKRAFADCSGLTSVTIPDSATSIGYDAFRGCSGIIEIENGVSYVDGWGIDCDGSVTSVELRDGTRGIANYAFEGCGSLQSVTISDSVTSIGDWAFNGCSGLTSIAIPDSVTSIGDLAFNGCSGLIDVFYQGDLSGWLGIEFDDYGANPMCYADNLYINEELLQGDIVIPEGTEKIGDYTFNGCSGLTSITIPDSVTSIGDYAFRECSGLTSITIPDSVTSIGQGAFYECSGLISITIPFVGKKAYGTGATHFGYIFGAAGSSYNDDYVPESLKEVIITGDTSIGSYAFRGCSGLTSIIIPDGVTSIGKYAF